MGVEMVITALRVCAISVLTLGHDRDAAVLATPASIAKTLASPSTAATVGIACGVGFAGSQARAICVSGTELGSIPRCLHGTILTTPTFIAHAHTRHSVAAAI
jgi:hypothetical protein